MMTTIVILGVLLLLIIGFLGLNRILPIPLKLHKEISQSAGIAINEYDAVSYFNKVQPVKGFGAYAYDYKNTVWLFSTQENLEAFKQNPERFEPQYGGYCTKAVSTGFTAPANPKIWTILKDKLYFFSSEKIKDDFLKNSDKMILSCNKKWNK